MKFAFSTLGCPDWSIEKVVEEAKRLGYDGVEIRGIKRVFDLSQAGEFGEEVIADTRLLFADAGLAVASIDASASFCWEDDEKQTAAFDEAARHVDIAERMGSKLVRVFGGNVPEGQPLEKWAGILADNLRRLADVAAPKGVSIMIETHDSWCRAADLMPVVETVGSKNVKVLWDLMHPWIHGESMAEAAARFGWHVVHCHIKDCLKDGTLTLLGEGEIPLEEAFRELRKMDFDGYVSLEWEKAWHEDLPDPEVAFPQAIEYMRELDKRTG
ncbi:MAG: sugar phosphate isomerase/epimerase family protein [Planctomycetota bacterium]